MKRLHWGWLSSKFLFSSFILNDPTLSSLSGILLPPFPSTLGGSFEQGCSISKASTVTLYHHDRSSFLSTKRRKVLEGSGCHSVFHCLEECLYHSRFFLKRISQKINIWLVAQLTTKQMNKELIIKIHYKVLPCALTFHSYCKHISEKLALQVNKNTVYRFTLTGKYVWLEPLLLPTCHD